MRFNRSDDVVATAARSFRGKYSTMLLFTAASCLAGSAAHAYDWPQFNGDAQHSGNNTSETTLGAANVASLGLKFQVTLPALSDGSPVFIDGVTTVNGVQDLLFVTTKLGHLVALDAHTGVQLWMKQYKNDAAGCSSGECTNSTPVIDPNRKYVYTYGLDGFVHKLQVGDGTEITTGGWPELSTLKPSAEKQSSALALATTGGTTYLYSAISAHNGDGGDNQGHVTSINLLTGQQTVFNMVCSDKTVHFTTGGSPDCSNVLSGSWARPGVIYDAGTNRIFVGTGNGHFNVAAFNWGDSVVALTPYGTGSGGKPLDSYTPTNQATLDTSDIDLGSTAPAILPVPASSSVQHLAVQSGKDAQLRLINLANLSSAGGPGNLGGEVAPIIGVPQGGAVRTQPAVWVNPTDNSTWVYVVNGSGASGLKLGFDGSGKPSLTSPWKNGVSGASPLVANNVLYYAGNSNSVVALNPTTGASLWSSGQIGSIHWQTPVVACAKVYILDQSAQLTSFGLALSRATVAGGNDQSALVGSAYANPLKALVSNSAGAAQSGVTVTFHLPASGASGTFAGGATTVTATTNASGVATSAALTANSLPGGFLATATVSGAECAASFHLANTSKYVPVTPARVLDTRTGFATIDGEANGFGALSNAGTLNLGVLGRGGVPTSGVSAVVLNVTVTNPHSAGYVTVFPGGSTLPNASNINFVTGQTIPNLVVAKVGSNGQVALYNGSLSTDLIADVMGYFTSASSLTSVGPARVLDTRSGASTIDGQFAGGGALAAAHSLNLSLAGRGGVPASGVGAVVLNVTATAPTAAGYITAWPTDHTQPLASNLNFVAGQTIANLVISAVSASGQVSLFNSAGSTQLIADVMGWFPTSSELTPLEPARVLDTRTGGTTSDGLFAGTGALGAGGSVDLTVIGRGGVPASGVGAVVLNVTVTAPTAAGNLRVWPSGTALPMASNLNFVPGQTIPNLVIAKLGANGKVTIYNSAGSTQVIADVVGWFPAAP